MIGFDPVIDMLQAAHKDISKYSPSWPPYNIKQIKENKYVIEMAVAGFTKTDIEITLEGNKMVVKGSTKEDEDETFLHKGIAKRSFERQFTLADKIEIKDAEIANGMLRVCLENMITAQDAIKKIGIKSKDE
jgi:molecular chaperone IbpA